jgi:hypothetical protein
MRWYEATRTFNDNTKAYGTVLCYVATGRKGSNPNQSIDLPSFCTHSPCDSPVSSTRNLRSTYHEESQLSEISTELQGARGIKPRPFYKQSAEWKMWILHLCPADLLERDLFCEVGISLPRLDAFDQQKYRVKEVNVTFVYSWLLGVFFLKVINSLARPEPLVHVRFSTIV